MNKKESETSILIVDDDMSTIEMLSMLLKKRGFEVGTAGNGNEALEFIKQRSVDVIISDLQMPELDGYQLLDIMKTSYRDHKVMVMSADMYTRDKLLRRGALETFSKPFSMNDFVEELKALLKERRKTKRFLSKETVRCAIKDPEGRVLARGQLFDISIDGAMVDLDADMEITREVTLELSLTDAAKVVTAIKGKVLRKSKKERDKPIQLVIYFDDERDLGLLESMETHISLKEETQ